jgi:radical SAM superfamily enzyme YgiQ (UPF0313 family)
MIALVRPMAPLNRYIQNVPLNCIHLAAYLRQQGFAPRIYDMVLDEVTEERVDREIREHGIRMVGIGAMTCEMPQAYEQARRLKAAHPGLTVVFGGAHPSGDPEECLQSGVVDYVVVGEGEIALARLAEAVRDGREPEPIPGVWRRREGAAVPAPIAPVPKVQELPRPAYDLLDLEAYFRLDSPWHFPKSRRAVQFITERGCPYQCSYCHEVHGKKFRGMDATEVVDQMEWLVRDYGVEEFMVVDDIFNFDLERAKEICQQIVGRGLKIHLQFPNGVRGDRFDEELVALMKKAGTHFMSIAIETVSERYQKLIRKHLKIDRALQTIHWARKHKIEVSGFFMIGFPGESEAEVKATLDYAVNAPLDAIFISTVSPFKGTKLRTDMLNGHFGELNAEGVQALDQLFPIVHSQTLPADRLNKMRQEAYWRFYTKPRSLLTLTKKLTNAQNIKKLSRAVTRRVLQREGVSVN